MQSGIAVIPLLFAGGLIVAALAPAQSQTPSGTWTQKAPMPAVRGEVAAAAVGDKLFAVGGGVAGKAVPRNEEYDTATDRWRPRAPLPQARDHVGVAALNGKIYAFGGFTSSVHQGAGDGVFEYDPLADRWQMLTPMQAPRASVGVAALDGRLHVIGGRGLDGVTVATHDVYDPATGKWWSVGAPLPRARDHMAVVAAGGRIHAIGGRLTGPADRTGQHDVYDPATDRWTTATPLPTPRSGVAAALYKDMILVLGGELPPSHTFPETEGYDPKADRWVTLAPMPAGRHGFGGAVIGPNAYFVGGSLTPGGGGITDQLIMFSLR
jgi:N-acetylneuraminic acid mutarotase